MCQKGIKVAVQSRLITSFPQNKENIVDYPVGPSVIPGTLNKEGRERVSVWCDVTKAPLFITDTEDGCGADTGSL